MLMLEFTLFFSFFAASPWCIPARRSHAHAWRPHARRRPSSRYVFAVACACCCAYADPMSGGGPPPGMYLCLLACLFLCLCTCVRVRSHADGAPCAGAYACMCALVLAWLCMSFILYTTNLCSHRCISSRWYAPSRPFGSRSRSGWKEG